MNHREQRAAIAQDTLDILKRGQYENQQGQTVSIGDALHAAIKGSVHYRGEQLQALAAQPAAGPSFTTQFHAANETTLAAARRLVAQGHDDVLCLNFASARNPGGGFLGGAEAQEENLAKSSGLYPCIQQMSDMYEANRRMKSCVYLDDMIYSPQVPVFRDDGYQYLDTADLISIITAPAVNRGAVARNEPGRLPEVADIMINRIELLLALAKHHGHTTLVLGAWGCGVFGNDPVEMAKWFARHLLNNPKYQSAFQKVCFAVLDRRDGGTYAAFAETFGAN
ncbi:TIGR02452 family protein [Andreprevotia chitinilytica]|uniref:TIGR02452 family protein n=1 Tax=Andreprevotia chitinilytica TaxID=396808 RepID=UPI00054DCA1D|nr:TIGR02452 family protein [Andreprevotia chitinilytica]